MTTLPEWRRVVGYEGYYEISSEGVVRSVARTVQSRNRFGPIDKTLRPKLMAQITDRKGYLHVRLCKLGAPSTPLVSRLVLMAFVGLPELGKNEAMHLDHNPANNRLHNLAWGSRQENEDQKTTARRRTKWSKLSPTTVEKIRGLREQGLTLKEIGTVCGTHLSNVSLIAKGKTWAK